MQLLRAFKAETRSKKIVGIWCGCAFQPCENDYTILKMHERLMEQGRAKKGKTAGSRGGRVGEREGRGNGGRQQSQMACLSGIETEDFSLICC